MMEPSPPDRAGATAEKAHYHVFSGRIALALQMIDQALIRDPEDPRLYGAKARALAAKGDAEGATVAARRAVELAPDDRRFHEILADIDPA